MSNRTDTNRINAQHSTGPRTPDGPATTPQKPKPAPSPSFAPKEMYEDKGEPHNPSEDGFVLTETQIENAILARNRERMMEAVRRHAAA